MKNNTVLLPVRAPTAATLLARSLETGIDVAEQIDRELAFGIRIKRNTSAGLRGLKKLASARGLPKVDPKNFVMRYSSKIELAPKYRVCVLGETFVVGTLGRVLVGALATLSNLDPKFLPALSYFGGRTRRYVAEDRNSIYPGRADLANMTALITRGWWVGTNYSRKDVERILGAACAVAGLQYGADLTLENLKDLDFVDG